MPSLLNNSLTLGFSHNPSSPLVEQLVPLSLGLKTNVTLWDLFPLDPHPQNGHWAYDGAPAVIVILEQHSINLVAQCCAAPIGFRAHKLETRPCLYRVIQSSLPKRILPDRMLCHLCLSEEIGKELEPGTVSRATFLLKAIDATK